MNLPPIYEFFRQRGMRFVTNAPDGKFKTNCPECKEPITSFVEVDADGLGCRCRCERCGFTETKRLQPARAKGDGNGAPRDDAAYLRAVEEAKRELDREPEPKGEQNLEEAIAEAKARDFPEDEPEPAPPPETITIEEATALRRALVAAGYCPIPLYGKEPPIYGKNNQRKGLPGWSDIVSVTDDMIVMWAKTWPDAVNTGVLTRNVPTLDLDILNEEAVRACEDLVHDRYEDAGPILVRIGLPPKRAIPFRTDEPFDKIIVNLIALNGSESQKIEFLCHGQQVVVAGIHPDSKRLYRWHGGKPGETKRQELPYTREEEARALVDDLVELLVRDFGYKRAPGRPGKPTGGGTGGNGADGGDPGGGAGADDWQYLLNNIREGRDLHHTLRDLAAKMIRAGTGAGATVNLLRAHMEGSNAPHDARWQERYDDIPRLVESAEERFGGGEPQPQPKPAPQPKPQQGGPQPSAIEKTLAVFKRWLILPSRTPVYAMLGAAAANYLEGDPVWLGLIGPPSSAKTELLNSTRLLPEVAPAANITIAGLLSGTPKGQYAKGAKGGLLREIGAFGIIMLKDFGSVLSMPHEPRAATLAALREIYDGRWSRDLGTSGGKKLVWEGKAGMLFGATAAIDSHYAVLSAMGDRFLSSRLAPAEAKEQFIRALDHAGAATKQMRKELAEAVAQLFTGRRNNPRAINKDERDEIAATLALAVRLRGALERDYRTRDIENIYGAEGTGRIGLALNALLAGLDTLSVKRETAMHVVLSVAMDSVPPLRRAAYNCVSTYGNVEPADVAIELGLPTSSVRRILEDLAAYGLITRTSGGPGKADKWNKAKWETA